MNRSDLLLDQTTLQRVIVDFRRRKDPLVAVRILAFLKPETARLRVESEIYGTYQKKQFARFETLERTDRLK